MTNVSQGTSSAVPQDVIDTIEIAAKEADWERFDSAIAQLRTQLADATRKLEEASKDAGLYGKDTERMNFLCDTDKIYWIHIDLEPHGTELFNSSLVHKLREAVDQAIEQGKGGDKS